MGTSVAAVSAGVASSELSALDGTEGSVSPILLSSGQEDFCSFGTGSFSAAVPEEDSSAGVESNRDSELEKTYAKSSSNANAAARSAGKQQQQVCCGGSFCSKFGQLNKREKKEMTFPEAGGAAGD